MCTLQTNLVVVILALAWTTNVMNQEKVTLHLQKFIATSHYFYVKSHMYDFTTNLTKLNALQFVQLYGHMYSAILIICI